MRADRRTGAPKHLLFAALVIAALCVFAGSCRLDPLPKTRKDALKSALAREIQRFRTKTDRNSACRTIMAWRAKAESKEQLRWIDQHVAEALLQAEIRELPPRCVDLTGEIQQIPDEMLVRILDAASRDGNPRVFAAAARALGRRQGRAALLAEAAFVAQVTGDGPQDVGTLDCGVLADFFDSLFSGTPTNFSLLLKKTGWQAAAPLRQAAWWILVRRGCRQEAWERAAGIAPLLRAEAMVRLGGEDVPVASHRQPFGVVALQAILAPVFARTDPKAFQDLSEQIIHQPCPKDPSRRRLVVSLLETLSAQKSSWSRALKKSMLTHIDACGPSWRKAADQWRRVATESEASRP